MHIFCPVIIFFSSPTSLMVITEGGVTGKEVDSLEPKKIYSGGNYAEFKKFLEKQTRKSDPKVCEDN